MSVQAITWALGKAPNIAMQAVLFSLANHADEWGITFVGHETVAGECSCRRATVTTNMGKLEAEGIITRFRRRDAGGRRSSDVVVLAPNWSDRGGMHDADKRAATMFSADAVAAAQRARGVHRRENQSTLHGDQSTPHGRLGTPSVHEPSVEPSVNGTTASSPSARDWPGVDSGMRHDADELLKRKVKVASRLVTEAEMEVAACALAEFNRQASSDYGLGAHLRSIVMRVRERPSASAEHHVRLVQSAWRVRWWERAGNGRKASPAVVYGERAFENVWQDAADEARGVLEPRPLSLKERTFSGGRTWDELTANEQRAAREDASIGIFPGDRERGAPAAETSEPWHPEPFTVDNF